MDKVRVYELAKEFGVDSRCVLNTLAEMGEFVRSASSTVEAPLVRRLKAYYGDPAPATPRRRQAPVPPATSPGRPAHRQGPADLFEALLRNPQSVRKRPRREWYRGEAPRGLTRLLLDEYVLRRNQARPTSATFWADEVAEARAISGKWARCVFEGLDERDILDWAMCRIPLEVDDALVLHRLGIRPAEIGWHYDDGRGQTLGERLVLGSLTVKKAANIIQKRRLKDRTA